MKIETKRTKNVLPEEFFRLVYTTTIRKSNMRFSY